MGTLVLSWVFLGDSRGSWAKRYPSPVGRPGTENSRVTSGVIWGSDWSQSVIRLTWNCDSDGIELRGHGRSLAAFLIAPWRRRATEGFQLSGIVLPL
jgi:hypothetical protein